MTKLSLDTINTDQQFEDLLLEKLIYGEFASNYEQPYFNLWFLGDNDKILPFHASASWDEPFLKKLYTTVSDQVRFDLQYIPLVEGVVFQRKDIREVGKDDAQEELYFATGNIYNSLEHRKIYRVINKKPYVTPYHMYIDQDNDGEGVRRLTREHILKIAFYGVSL